MKEIYTIKDDHLVIALPLKVGRYNPYIEMAGKDGYVGEMDNVVGIIEKDDYGFGFWIDFSYKGKPDQTTSILFHYGGNQEEFEKFCKKAGIIIVKY